MKPSIPLPAARAELSVVERQIRSLSQRKNYLKRILSERVRVYVWRNERTAA